MDWSGRLWIRSEQVLYWHQTRKPNEESMMLTNASGDETGWFVDVKQLGRLLSLHPDPVRDELQDWLDGMRTVKPRHKVSPRMSRIHEFIAMTWNLHGKHLAALKNLLDGMEDQFDCLVRGWRLYRPPQRGVANGLYTDQRLLI